MLELNTQIARLEICSEQLRLHLRSIPRDCVEADEVRSDLLTMLLNLTALKGQRQKLETALRLEVAA